MSLTKIQSLRVAALLEDCSLQFDIMGLGLEAQRNKVQERSAAAARERARLAKCKNDCDYLSQLMTKLRLELEQKQSFDSLLQIVEEEDQEITMRDAKEEQLETLKVQQKQEELGAKKFSLMLKKERLKRMNEMNETLEERSHNLELKKISMQNADADKQLEDQLEFMKKQIKEEKRAHEESTNFLKNQHKELLEEVQSWEQHLERLLQEKRMELESMCQKKAQNLERLNEMRRKFAQMELVVKDDREEQERLRQQEAEIRAATKLQAWWRGCMFRKGLGHFKKGGEVKKGKKGGKKKTKKK
ncbi:dynein regulatory complex protein 9-like [Pholidichthys leucotaenia]